MNKSAVKCFGCGDTLYSRTIHDYRTCTCGHISIDGGDDYVKITYDPNAKYGIMEIDVPFTDNELYEDWNTGADQLGLIKDGLDEHE